MRVRTVGASSRSDRSGQVKESGVEPPDFHSFSRIHVEYSGLSCMRVSVPSDGLVRVMVPSPDILRTKALSRVQILGADERSAGVDMLMGANAVAPTMAPARARVLSESMLVGGSGVELKRKRQGVSRELEREWCGVGKALVCCCVSGERSGGWLSFGTRVR